MGDRYTLELRCDWCGEMNHDIWYAPSSGATSFGCKYCGKPSEIIPSFESKRIEAPAALSPQPRPRKRKGTDAIPTQSKDSEEK